MLSACTMIMLGPPIRPLSAVKQGDIRIIAQRMIDEHGYVHSRRLYQRGRPRIPGSEASYTATLLRLSHKRLLNTSKTRYAFL